MAEKRICPACKKEIKETATRCPECQKQLEILCWEIEQESGQMVLYSGEGAEASIREDLISGKLRLLNRCRQHVKVLERVEQGEEQYGLKKEMEWKTLRDYTDNVSSLQGLYNPVKAYGREVAMTTWKIAGIIIAVGWNTDALLAAGSNPLVAIVISSVLLLLTPTGIGLGIGSVVIGNIYHIPPLGIVIRNFVAIILGILVGGAVGWTLGYVIGALIGLTKEKVLEG
jgi:hypothetical protein